MDHFEGLLAKKSIRFCAKQANLTSVASPQKKKKPPFQMFRQSRKLLRLSEKEEGLNEGESAVTSSLRRFCKTFCSSQTTIFRDHHCLSVTETSNEMLSFPSAQSFFYHRSPLKIKPMYSVF